MIILNSTSFQITLFFAVLLLLSSCSDTTVKTLNNYDWRELPDGSIVYLNHNSSIKYDETFAPRNISLEGEAFFSVASGETPFIVATTHGDITVSGTEFNVRSTTDEMAIEVEEGSVELTAAQEHVKLNRGDRAVFNVENRTVHKGKAEFEFMLWMGNLEIEFKKLGKEVKRSTNEIGKQSKKVGKEFKKEAKKLKIN